MSAKPLDLQQVRARFPALQQKQAFLDNAGGSQILDLSIEAIKSYLIEANVQPVGKSYPVEVNSTTQIHAGYNAASRFLNATEDEIAFGASATQLFRTLSQALTFHEGDELIVSSLEHEANIAPWADIAERQNLVVKWWQPEQTTNPKLTIEGLRSLLSPRTRLVACTHANNVLGTINDIAAITKVVHSNPGTLICVDGVAYAPHRPVDVKDLGVDFYTISWYKVFGPHCAVMYASQAAQDSSLRSLGHFFNPKQTLRDKLTFGSGGYELIAGIVPVVNYLTGSPRSSSMWTAICNHETALQSTLLNYLRSRTDITIYGEPIDGPQYRLPIVSFTVTGWSSVDVVRVLMKEKSLGLRASNFYAFRLMDTLRLDPKDGVIRISLLHYNTLDEIDSLIEALENVKAR